MRRSRIQARLAQRLHWGWSYRREIVVLFYLSALAVAGAVAMVVLSVVLALLFLTSDERCRKIEDNVQTRVLGRFSRRAKPETPTLDHPHAPSA
jgi:hypothetical protein